MDRYRFPILPIVAVLAATIGLPPGIESGAAGGRRITIDIRQFKFEPSKPLVRIGDMIVWRNRDIVPHTATARDGSWDSGIIEAGSAWQTTVTPTMLGGYFCAFHPSMTASR